MADTNELNCGDAYQEHFDPIAYLTEYFSTLDQPDDLELLRFVLRSAHKLSRLIPKEYTGKILEVGSGPTIHNAAVYSGHFDKVYLSEFSKANREVTERWLAGEKVHDWSEIFGFIAEQEGITVDELEARAKTKIQGIIPVDVRAEVGKFVPQLPVDTVDAVATTLCIQPAVSSWEEYRNALTGLHALIRPGGYLIYFDTVNCRNYRVGTKYFTNFPASEDEMISLLESVGFEIVEYMVHRREEQGCDPDASDFEASFNLLAKKK